MDALKKEDGESLNIIDENIEALKNILPDAFTEDGIDFDTLRQLLGDTVADGDEKYGLTWHGKKKARQIALTPSTGTLRPCPEESIDWDTTQNLFIEGDNLEVLKLLTRSYGNKVKMIYIDPPYNTGRNLIYPNDFQDGVRAYLEVTGQKEGGTKLTSNPDGSGRFHTNWLSMIYPRLKLARRLLSPDGILVVTIDDNEQSTLGVILREIFEEGSYDHVCVPIVHNPRGVQGKNFSYVHEYAFFVYPSGTKAIANTKIEDTDIDWSQFRNWGTESERSDAKNCFYPIIVQNDQIVGFGDVCPDEFHPDQTEWDGDTAYVYPIDRSGVERKWRYAKQSVEAIKHLLRAKKRRYGYEIELGKDFGLYKTIWSDPRYDANDYGTGVVNDLVPGSPFTFPKSLWAVYDSILAATADDKDAIVLDFFAGSGTTAHSVMQLNKDDGGNRRFILVQLPEPIEKNEKFSNIAEVTKARLRAAADDILQDSPGYEGDFGFKVFKLDSSNIRAWNPDTADLEKSLLDHAEHLVEGRSEQDVLYELLLKRGVDLTVPIEEKEIAGKAVYSIGFGVLFACLDDKIEKDEIEPLAQGITEWHKELDPASDTQVVFRDSAFADDIAKTNMTAILEQNGVAHVRSL
ncbi:site-specific DNA-methyltransferase [Aquibaculum sediminis]|uniref:site-specific DNA-methyltransferase n=1 Tax=Aquibaculum sediminis TaxID=3231907 RepID=UPI003451BAEE